MKFRNKANQYYASVLFEVEEELPPVSTKGKAIGLNMGLTDFCITSDGSKYANPRWLARQMNSPGGQEEFGNTQACRDVACNVPTGLQIRNLLIFIPLKGEA